MLYKNYSIIPSFNGCSKTGNSAFMIFFDRSKINLIGKQPIQKLNYNKSRVSNFSVYFIARGNVVIFLVKSKKLNSVIGRVRGKELQSEFFSSCNTYIKSF